MLKVLYNGTAGDNMMRKFALIILAIALIITSASAYEVILYAPDSLQVGNPVLVNGTTDLPPGVSLNIVFSREYFGSEPVSNETVVIQGNGGGNNSFSLDFSTVGLPPGQYKVEVAPVHDFSFLGDSVTLRSVTLVDRSGEITFGSPLKKLDDGTLQVAGTDEMLKNGAVQLTITDPDGIVVFGPEFIPTNMFGAFSKSLSIQKTGNYSVSFADRTGLITNMTYSILPKPVPDLIIARVTATPTPEKPAVSASSFSSRENPAVFVIVSNPGTILLRTSTGIDWVLAYQSPDGSIHRVNNAGTLDPETVTLQSDGNMTWVEVYPYKFDENGTITLSAENAVGVQADGSGAGRFMPETTAVPGNVQTTPLSPLVTAGALAALAVFRIRAIKR
ncbi:MAG TPA: hypothetical protein VMS89_05650 [Methanoregulaceae archaeon]|nr:hypothetical protein [Methanoregulaceae archaeon]